MKQIAILHHAAKPLDDSAYFIRLLMAEWQRMGWSVVVIDHPRRFVPADLAIAHIDLTRIPDSWLELFARYPRVINGALRDISKSRISSLAADEEWRGPVIVKTEANYAGLPEHLHASRARRALRRLANWRGGLDPRKPYPVYERLEDVPARRRRDPRLVVQRFVPERDGDLYVLRFLTFFGARAVTVRTRSTEPVVKSRGFVDAAIVDTPPALLAQAHTLGADYAKVDFVLHDGEPVIFDVNRTPTFSGGVPNERHLFVARTLAPGIED